MRSVNLSLPPLHRPFNKSTFNPQMLTVANTNLDKILNSRTISVRIRKFNFLCIIVFVLDCVNMFISITLKI